MVTRRRSKGAYMISSVAEMYDIHPQTLRLYEREGLLKPSRTDGNTRLYTDEDLERLEFILNLARDLGVNIAGIAIILQMRERMEEMNRQMQGFVDYVRTEMLSQMQQGFRGSESAMVPLKRPLVTAPVVPLPKGKGNPLAAAMSTGPSSLAGHLPEDDTEFASPDFADPQVSVSAHGGARRPSLDVGRNSISASKKKR